MRVLIAPDSFKGSATAEQVAAAIAAGWQSRRPQDQLRRLPMADGGEGSAAAIISASPGAREIRCRTTGPDGRPARSSWWLLSDGTAVVELAQASGASMMAAADPLGAQTIGFGELLRSAATDPRVHRICATLGGSAATDGGTGALHALGARFLDAAGNPLAPGGGSLRDLAAVDVSQLTPPPPDGVRIFADVSAPLLGPTGSAAVFGPQKGASAADIAVLEAGLTRLAALVGGDADRPGAGASGGTGFGLAALWTAESVPGAARIGELIGLPAAVAAADLVITGEGRFDSQSTTGKVVGHLLEQVAGKQLLALIVGQFGVEPPAHPAVALDRLAGSAAEAIRRPSHWLRAAGARLAAGFADAR